MSTGANIFHPKRKNRKKGFSSRVVRCEMLHPRQKLVEIISTWVVTATRIWTSIFCGDCWACRHHRARVFTRQFLWQSRVLQRHYTRQHTATHCNQCVAVLEAHSERGRKLEGWYCWGHGTRERSRRCRICTWHAPHFWLQGDSRQSTSKYLRC